MGKIDNIDAADYGDRFVGEGYTEDIIDALRRFVARRGGKGTEKYAAKLKSKSVREVAQQIWNDLKHKIRYKRDPKGVQNLKSAERLVADNEGDCKSYSIFTASVLTNLGIRFVIRFAKYSAGNFTHVYVVAFDENNKPIIIDAVWTDFDSEKLYYEKIDYLPMKVEIHELTGFDDPEVRDYLEGIESIEIAGLEYDVSGLADIGKIRLPAKIIAAGKGAVQKVVNQGIKPAINWLFQKAIAPVAPFFLFQWVKNHPNKEVIRRRDVQRGYLQKVSNFFNIKMDDILGAMAKSIQSKHGKSPQQIIDDATRGKISGFDEIGMIINPATIQLAVSTLKQLTSYLMKLFNAKVQELSEKDGSDLALLSVGGGRNNFGGDTTSLTKEEKSLVMKNGKIIPFFDKDSNQVVDGEWLHPSGRVNIEKVNLQLLKARYTDEELAVVAKNGKIRKIFDMDGNGKVNGEFLKPNGRVDLQKCKEALSGKKKEEKKDDKGKGNGKGGGALPPDHGKGGKKGDDTKADDKTQEPVTDGNGTGGKEPPTDQTGNGGGGNGGKNNTLLYVAIGGAVLIGVGAFVYAANKK